ncbi:MAG: CRISPR-associated endonuclease Cas2 [Caldisphaeraceae archaeon]|nr:CRISPR-associated endonuclease Cas2 [Caldisphaeraceae archaeon]MEB3691954.1 CRISPR-associated endonuclease Cas2 [Caldisphaeraceae archaeon]
MMLLVIYDISSNEKRLKMSKALMQEGLSRIQKSAFVGRAGSALFREIEVKARSIVDEKTDIVHMVRVSELEWNGTKIIGRGVNAKKGLGWDLVY